MGSTHSYCTDVEQKALSIPVFNLLMHRIGKTSQKNIIDVLLCSDVKASFFLYRLATRSTQHYYTYIYIIL